MDTVQLVHPFTVNYGKTPAVANVPEPSMPLVLLGVLAVLQIRRRR